MNVDLIHIENQLENRLHYPYKWGQKQNDQWDSYTNFIYKTPDWEALVKLMKVTCEAYDLEKMALFQYAANRWYNFWSAMAVEKIFTEINGVKPALNTKNRLVDFTCFGIDFDHKTSVFPKGFDKTVFYAKTHKEELLYWFYKHQSQQRRKHLKNRLFLVVYAENGQHWKLKAKIQWLKSIIQHYISTFDASKLTKLQFENEKTALADIVWAME